MKGIKQLSRKAQRNAPNAGKNASESPPGYDSVLLGLFVVDAPGLRASLAKKSLSLAFSSMLSFCVRGDLGVSSVARVVSRSFRRY